MQEGDEDSLTNSDTFNELQEEHNGHTSTTWNYNNTTFNYHDATRNYGNNIETSSSSNFYNDNNDNTESSYGLEDDTESSSCWNEEDITESSRNEEEDDGEDDSWIRLFKIIEEEEGEIQEENNREEASNKEKEAEIETEVAKEEEEVSATEKEAKEEKEDSDGCISSLDDVHNTLKANAIIEESNAEKETKEEKEDSDGYTSSPNDVCNNLKANAIIEESNTEKETKEENEDSDGCTSSLDDISNTFDANIAIEESVTEKEAKEEKEDSDGCIISLDDISNTFNADIKIDDNNENNNLTKQEEKDREEAISANIIWGTREMKIRNFSMPLLHTTTTTSPIDFRMVLEKRVVLPIENNISNDSSGEATKETNTGDNGSALNTGSSDNNVNAPKESAVDKYGYGPMETNNVVTGNKGRRRRLSMPLQQQFITETASTTANFSTLPNKGKAEEQHQYHLNNGTKTKIGRRQRRLSMPMATAPLRSSKEQNVVSGNTINKIDFRSVLKGGPTKTRSLSDTIEVEQTSTHKNLQLQNNTNNKIEHKETNNHFNAGIGSGSLPLSTFVVQDSTTITTTAAATTKPLKKEKNIIAKVIHSSDYQQHHDNNEKVAKVGKRRMKRRSTMPFSFTATDPAVTTASKLKSKESGVGDNNNEHMFDFRSVLKEGNKEGNSSFDGVDTDHQKNSCNISQNKETMQHQQQQQKWQQLINDTLRTATKEEEEKEEIVTYASSKSWIAPDAVMEGNNTSLTYDNKSTTNNILVFKQTEGRGKHQKNQRIPLSQSNSKSSVLTNGVTLKKVVTNNVFSVELGYQISYAGNLLLKEVDEEYKHNVDNNNNNPIIKYQLRKIELGEDETSKANRSSTLQKKKDSDDGCTLERNSGIKERSENNNYSSSSDGNSISSISSAKKYWKSLKSYSSSFSSKQGFRTKNDGKKVESVANPSSLRSTDGVQYTDMEEFRSSHCASGRFVDKLQYFEMSKTNRRKSDNDNEKPTVLKQQRRTARRFSVM